MSCSVFFGMLKRRGPQPKQSLFGPAWTRTQNTEMSRLNNQRRTTPELCDVMATQELRSTGLEAVQTGLCLLGSLWSAVLQCGMSWLIEDGGIMQPGGVWARGEWAQSEIHHPLEELKHIFPAPKWGPTSSSLRYARLELVKKYSPHL